MSAPASAHAALLSGSTVCSDGTHVVNWSIGNDWPTPMTITSASATLNGQSYAVVGYTSPVYSGSPTSAISTLPGGSIGSVTLTVNSSWPDGVTHTRSTSVALEHNCSGGTTTTAAATTTTAGATTTTAAPTTTTAAATTTTAAPTTTTEAATTTTAGGATTTTAGGATTTSIDVEGSTTVPGNTTTTEAVTTTTEAPTTTTEASTTSGPPVTQQGSTVPIPTTSTTQESPVTQQAVTTIPTGGENLPRTGSSPTLPVLFGGSCLVVGAALAMRKRKTWTRP